MDSRKRYNVYLNEASVGKVKRVLSKAHINFSSYVSVMVDAFAEIIDETDMDKKMDNMSMSQCMSMVAGIMEKVENARDEDLERGVEKLKSLTAEEEAEKVEKEKKK